MNIKFKLSFATAALLSALLVSSAVAAQEGVSKTAKLADGTPIRLTLDENLGSATAQAGDAVHLEVAEDVRVDNVVAIPAGSAAGGHVVVAEHKKRLGRAGKVNFAVDYVKMPDGNNLKVRASAGREGKDKIGKVIVGTVLVSPLFMLMHGKDVNIPKGTSFTAYVDGDRQIALSGSSPAPPTGTASSQPAADPSPSSNPLPSSDPQTSGQQQASSAADAATVLVKSTPDGADISLDGGFVGSTPSTLRVPTGRHTITVDMSGFKAWQRTLTVTADETITIDASMEKNL